MRNPAYFSCICTFLLAALLCTAGCTSAPPGTEQPVPPGNTPGIVTPSGSSCGLTTCHGLELACGPDAPDVCTMEYRLGDKCRQYARCEVIAGECTLVTDPEFETCKSCVERCEATGDRYDPTAAFDCEAKC
jgi:hypothetical protein